MSDTLYTIENDRSHEIKIQRSRFICSMRHVTSLEDAKAFISEIAAQHKQANHNCWAYVVGDNGELFHASDAGEPSGTAGKPMLNSLKRHNLTKVSVVVTRYFGGIKLGIRGLIEAYTQAVEECIQTHPLKKILYLRHFNIVTDYGFAETLKHRISGLKGNVADASYTDKVTLTVDVEMDNSQSLFDFLTELQQSGTLKFHEMDHAEVEE